jgi:hypothetical protein
MYGEVMRRQPGRKLSSDTDISGSASGVWERLARNPGYSVSKSPATNTMRRTIKGDPKGVFRGPILKQVSLQGPVYEGQLPAQAAL